MPKSSGLGDRLFVGGYDISGDVGSLSRIGGGMTTQDVTGIDKSAFERLGLLRDGAVEYSGFFNDSPTQAHQTLKGLPTADVPVVYCRGALLGNQAAGMVSKQVNYDWNREADGSIGFEVQALANGTGLEWGQQLTGGMRNDTGAATLTALDMLAQTNFGGALYIQVQSFTGTTVQFVCQDSADNTTFTNVAGLSVSGVTAAPFAIRIPTTLTTTPLRRYARMATIGTLTQMTWSAILIKNETAVAP